MAPKSKAPAEHDPWLVAVTSYPMTGRGCHRGRQFSEAELVSRSTTAVEGQFETEEEAVAQAKRVRQCTAEFEDWADEHFGTGPPPWDSVEGENFDNDSEVLIRVVRQSVLDAEKKADEALLQKAARTAAQKQQKKKKQKESALQRSGKVHYSFPGPPRGVDANAELEVLVDADLLAYAVPRGEKFDKQKHARAEPAQLAGCRSLMIRATDGAVAEEGFVEQTRSLLEACTSLEELHWHDAAHISRILCGTDAEGENPKQSRLTRSLRVLSLPYCSRNFGPEELADLAIFSGLEALDLRSSLDMELGIGHPATMRDPYDSDEGGDCEPLPYSEALVAVAQANRKLKEVDLDGILDFDAFSYCLDQHAVCTVEAGGARVKLGRKTAW